MKCCFSLALLAVLESASLSGAESSDFYWPGNEIGSADAAKQSAEAGQAEYVLSNGVLAARFQHAQSNLRLVSLQDRATSEMLPWADANLFTLRLKGSSLSSSSMRLTAGPAIADLTGIAGNANLATRSAGKSLSATFTDDATGITVRWSAILRNGSNYLRQQIVVTTGKPIEVSDIEMINASVKGAKLAGYTDGAPVVSGNWFFGLEHPMAKNTCSDSKGWTPAEMEANRIRLPITGLQPGAATVGFAYKSGNHGLTIEKVALEADGKIVAEDTHAGFAGLKSSANDYVLQVPPKVREGTLIATFSNKAGEFNGFGDVTTSNGVLPAGHISASLPRGFVLNPGMTWTVSTAAGIAPAGQLRRAFSYYLQRERAHPYRQYWHYNSWYDLNIDRNNQDDPLKRMNERQCLDVIAAFDKNLYQKHKVGLDGFVWDDGWDDWNTLWDFHKGFPDGFKNLNAAARSQGAGMGAWLSPWGGYGRSQGIRVALGQKKGYETNGSGLSLGGPKYRAVFRDTCLKMIRDHQQNYFKFDGIGTGTWATGAPPSISPDLDGLISVIGDLRQANPSVFINCTVGTWASPYWTFFADSIWRQAEDTEFIGKGNGRERWINYKDGIVHRRFTSASPLFPLNSLMYHGLVLGSVANPGKMPTPAQDFESFRHELLMMVGYGSGLDELYVTPALMNDEAWTLLAECIRFSRTNERLLGDSHWIGGDPEKNEIYGAAAWNPADGGILTLRNPDDKPQACAIDLASFWELPGSVSGEVELRSPWTRDKDRAPLKVDVKKATSITLQPFEVITLRAAAIR